MVIRCGSALIFALCLMTVPATAQQLLLPGQPVRTGAGSDAGVRYRIDAPAGSYIAGRIQAGVVPVTADLLDGQGRHLRRLADQARGNISFQAMTGATTFLQLTAPAEVGLQLNQIVPPAQQIAPAPDYASPRIAALADALSGGATTAAFWDQVTQQGTPLIEDAGDGKVIMTFLWRGAARNVRLFGGPSNDHEWLERLGNSDVWYKSFTVPADTRLSYKLAPDVPDVPGDARSRRAALVATAQMDPLNHHPWPKDAIDRFNRDATVTLDAAPPQPGTPPDPAADPLISRFDFHSAALANTREITVSRPRDLDPTDPQIVVAVIFDGEQALKRIDAPRMLDTLTRQGRLPPVVAVLVPSIDSQTRARELPGNRVFADALADELMPQVARHLGITPDPARTVLAGASYGGLAAATIALSRPDAFGNALAMSGSFWWAPEGTDTDSSYGLDTEGTPWVAAQVTTQDPKPVRFFLSAGRFETARGGSAGILETSQILRDTLRLRGYAVTWRAYAGGHDYLVWRGALADGLIALFAN